MSRQKNIMHLPISFRVASLELGRQYDYPPVNEVKLKDTGKITDYLTTKKNQTSNIKHTLVGNKTPM